MPIQVSIPANPTNPVKPDTADLGRGSTVAALPKAGSWYMRAGIARQW
jgi:hypothetical protein